MQQFSPYNTSLMSDHIWVLKRWQMAGYTNAIIGGGAVRDIFFRQPPNDIDIFYNKTSFEAVLLTELVSKGILHKKPEDLSQLFADLFQLDLSSPGVYDEVYLETFNRRNRRGYASNRIISIKTMMKEGRLYQFVALDMDPIEYAKKHFDTGICMCWCDGTKFHYTNEFLHDAVNETITICGDMTKKEYEYSQRVHIKKLQRKFPTFRIVDNVKDKFVNQGK